MTTRILTAEEVDEFMEFAVDHLDPRDDNGEAITKAEVSLRTVHDSHEALRAEVERITGERDALQEHCEAWTADLYDQRREGHDNFVKYATLAEKVVAKWRERAEKAEAERDENEGVFKVWRRRCNEAVAERDALRLLVEGVARASTELEAWYAGSEILDQRIPDKHAALQETINDAIAACVAWTKESQ